MRKYERTITIPLAEIEKTQTFLDSKNKGEGGVKTIETYTVKFDDPGEWDVRIDIRVCQGDIPYVVAVLFQSGKEISFLDAHYTLTGKYVFEGVLKDTYEVTVMEQKEIARCSCGNPEFYAHQVCRMDIVCDGDGNWIKNIPSDDSACYDSDDPFGPFTCTKCKKEYEELIVSEWWGMRVGDKINFLMEQKVSKSVAMVWIASEGQFRLDLQKYIDIMDHLNS